MAGGNNKEIIERLENKYPDAKTALNYENPFQLLVATILSAQTTDKQVNTATERLFEKYKTPYDFAKLLNSDLEQEIKGCGLYKNKANNIIKSSKTILDKYKGNVPKTLEELISLPGVGRKTANVVLNNAYNIPAIAVDTHVFRVSRRLGLASGKTPEKTEAILRKKIPQKLWGSMHHWLIYHGRNYCLAKKPKCQVCFLEDLCPEKLD